MSAHDFNDLDAAETPPRLVEALRQLRKERIFVPPQIDEQILAKARRHLGEAEPQTAPSWAGAGWWAAAAAVIVAAGLTLFLFKPGAPPSWAAEDIDRNGRIDVLDAFALARLLQTRQTGPFDFNHDGRVDRLDVDVVATRAVRLEGGS